MPLFFLSAARIWSARGWMWKRRFSVADGASMACAVPPRRRAAGKPAPWTRLLGLMGVAWTAGAWGVAGPPAEIPLVEQCTPAAGGFISQQAGEPQPRSCQAADDFRIRDVLATGPERYELTRVVWRGSYFDGEAPVAPPDPKLTPRSFRVLFYRDLDGQPDTLSVDPAADAIASYDVGLFFVSEADAGVDGVTQQYSVALDPPLLVDPSLRYWVVVQCLLDGPLDWRVRLAAPTSVMGRAARGGCPQQGVAYWTALGSAAHPAPQQLAICLYGREADFVPPEPPAAATQPLPADATENQPRRLSLSWTGAADALVYEVFFGTSAALSAADSRGTTLETVYYPPAELSANQTYFWRVDARGTGGVTTGRVWSFRTAARAITRCDCNCDGRVNYDDIDGFIVALTGAAAYLSAYPACVYRNADADGSGVVDFNDISAFIGCLTARSGGEIEAPLAGNPLPMFPHFQHVEVVQSDQPVRIAVDPARYPHVAGRQAQVYITPNRSRELWDNEPHLLDVSPGGAHTIMFTGATINQNIRTLALAGELTALTGTALGVGYDVVVDLNENGILDAGDLVDGRGDEPGFVYVRNLTQLGPRPTASIVRDASAVGLPPGMAFAADPTCGATTDPCTRQKIFYPTDVASGERLPLIVFSHGNTHNLRWYDYLGRQLASYGYVALLPAINAEPGIGTAASSTLLHIEAFFAQLPEIAGGVLTGRVDPERQVWIGHSRGGEGVVLALDRIRAAQPTFVPAGYAPSAVRGLALLAPTDFSGPLSSAPADTPTLLLYGSADGDVYGGPDNPAGQPFAIFERAAGARAAVYLHGADHNYFNCCGVRDWSGTPGYDLTRPIAQKITRAALLAFLGMVLRDERELSEYFWRQFEELRPSGVPALTPSGHEVTVDRDSRRLPDGGEVAVIDNFQSQPDPALSSAGGAVTANVINLRETRLGDTDGTFAYSPDDAAQGMTRARPADLARGATFEAPAGVNTFIEFSLPAALRDWRDAEWLSLRVCQITRAPLTRAILADSTFHIAVRDAAGNQRSLNIGAYGGGVEEPYARAGFGDGVGWANAFETMRIRIDDFRVGGEPLDLAQIVALRLQFGPSFGSDGMHLGLDDVELIGK